MANRTKTVKEDVRVHNGETMTKIFVLLRGWVLVGVVESEDEHSVRLSRAACVRRWGTTKGLGELASSGPTPSTVLDLQPPTRLERRGLLQTIDANPEAWSKALEART